MAKGGDCLTVVKANQPALHDDVKLLMNDADAPADDVAETVDADHGRIETRRAEGLHDVDWLAESHRWPGLAGVGKVTATREIDGRATTSSRYDIASRALSATELNQRARGHGGIENPLHGVLDVVVNEDQARARKDNAPEILALRHRLARNIIERNADKGSNRLKFKRAGWEDRCLAKLISEIA